MKKQAMILIVLMCGAAWGQQGGTNLTVHGPPKPALTCPKYQHVYHWPETCGPAPCDDTGCYAICMPPPPDRCVDDMHEVTEREWQALTNSIKTLGELDSVKSKQVDLLQKRVQRLEDLICENNAGILWDCRKKKP